MKPINLPASGKYEFIVRDIASGKITKHIKNVKNLIVDAGFDRWMSNLTFMDWAFVGTGSTPPVVANTAMQTYLAETNDVVNDTTESVYAAPRYFVQKGTFTFAPGAVVGNVSEVGVGWKVSTTRLVFSRSLVVDGGGSPTTITVLATEQLTVIYRLYVKIPDADITFAAVDGAANYTVTARPAFSAANNRMSRFLNGFFGTTGNTFNFADALETDVLPAIASGWTVGLTANRSTAYTPAAYVAGTFKATLVAQFTGGLAVFPSGIGSVAFGTREGAGVWMFSFAPKIPKLTGQTLTLTFEYTLSRGTPP